MPGREKDWTIEEQAAHWERRKKHDSQRIDRKERDDVELKKSHHLATSLAGRVKHKNQRLDPRFIDIDSEAWYE